MSNAYTKDVFSPLRRAVVHLLANDPGLLTALGGPHVYDDQAPAEENFPYITVTVGPDTDWGTKTTAGHSTSLTIDVWDRGLSWRKSDACADRIMALLGRQLLTVPGFHPLHTWYEDSTNLAGPLAEQLHRSIRFRVKSLEAA